MEHHPPPEPDETHGSWLLGGALAVTVVIAVGVVWQLKPRSDAPDPANGSAARDVESTTRARTAPPAPPAPPASASLSATPATRTSGEAFETFETTDTDDDLLLDQPVDDTPPASVTSPDVREAWLARIRELVAAGRHEDARASFAEFRRRHPDAPVPDELRMLGEE